MLVYNYELSWVNWVIYAINRYKFLDIEDFTNISIDISCTREENYVANINKMTEIIKMK